MFSDYAIWETSAGRLEGQERLAAQLGIRTLVSSDTYNYAARRFLAQMMPSRAAGLSRGCPYGCGTRPP
ncbi:MAG: hypothetical protein AB7S38_34245 [Vulcanimicrobiota bacterium]